MSFDTVNFRLTKDDSNTDFLSETPCYLQDVNEHHFANGNTVLTGNLSGYTVSISDYQIKIKDCSLCKWHLGDNFKEMTRGDTKQAVERLSDLLHLPIDKAAVTRLDFALNIITQHPTDVYFRYLGTLSHYKRLVQPDGVYYWQNAEKFVLYNKVKEQRKAGAVIPDLYQNRNVLRIEQRYLSRINDRLKYAVTGATLYDESFYNMLLNRWRDTYNDIAKINDVTLNFSAMKTKKDAYRLGILALIERAGGQVEFMAQITEAQKRGELSKKQAYDLRAVANEAMKTNERITAPNEVITELDGKVKRAVKFYR